MSGRNKGNEYLLMVPFDEISYLVLRGGKEVRIDSGEMSRSFEDIVEVNYTNSSIVFRDEDVLYVWRKKG